MDRRGIVLLYHRVCPLMADPQLLMVTPENFAEHLKVISEQYSPIHLSDLVQKAKENSLPENAVALTFDDGYADNAIHALPLLEKYSVPATIFITSSKVGQSEELWWDEMERLVFTCPTMPREIRLTVGAHDFYFDLGKDAEMSPLKVEQEKDWSVLSRDNPTKRHELYRQLYAPLLNLSHLERCAVLDDLRSMIGVPPEGRPTHRVANEKEVASINSSPMTTVGAHTLHHPRLSSLSKEQQRMEIQESKARLEALTGGPIVEFSYPYGSRKDYNDDSVQVVKESGFEIAVSNFPGSVGAETDCLQIPRHIVRNISGADIELQLQDCFSQ